MCGRYGVEEDTEKEIRRIVSGADENVEWGQNRDIYPSETAIVITGKRLELFAENMRWGFPLSQSKQLMINARAETVLEKRSFSDSILRRRCVIPAHQFYEWDRNKNKVTFTWKEEKVLYMAGFYKGFEGGNRFMILTTAANESMSSIHDRMPLILPEKEVKNWIFDKTRIKEFLKMKAPALSHFQDYEQMTLF